MTTSIAFLAPPFVSGDKKQLGDVAALFRDFLGWRQKDRRDRAEVNARLLYTLFKSGESVLKRGQHDRAAVTRTYRGPKGQRQRSRYNETQEPTSVELCRYAWHACV